MKRLLLVAVLVGSSSTLLSEDSAKVVNDGFGDYVLVPAGEFLMGDNFNEGSPRELPVHTVYLDAYYVGKAVS
jgi:formylglycine-generating enzyme required for sulfatase activity